MEIRGFCLFTLKNSYVGCGLYELGRIGGNLVWINVPCVECWVSLDHFPQDEIEELSERAIELGYPIFRREYVRVKPPIHVPAFYSFEEGDL